MTWRSPPHRHSHISVLVCKQTPWSTICSSLEYKSTGSFFELSLNQVTQCTYIYLPTSNSIAHGILRTHSSTATNISHQHGITGSHRTVPLYAHFSSCCHDTSHHLSNGQSYWMTAYRNVPCNSPVPPLNSLE
jgi:hypothetical protein